MAPVPTAKLTELAKRYYYTNYSSNRTYRPWWVVFCVVVPIVILLLLCLSFRRRNFKRKAQGQTYVPYTGWTTYQWGNNNNNQQQQQPYYKPEGGNNYDYNNQPSGQGYNQDYNNQGYNNQGYNQDYNNQGYNQPPSYGQTTGGANETQYQRPEGPPPTQGPSYPANAHTKS